MRCKPFACGSIATLLLLGQLLFARPAASETVCRTNVTLGRDPGQTLLIAKRDQKWFVRGSATSGEADLCFIFGNPGDVGVMGDWNGDGEQTPGVFRPSTGTWYLSNSTFAATVDGVFRYGSPGDIPVAGDWDMDGKDTIGVFRRGVWLLTNHNGSGFAEGAFRFGEASDQPLDSYSECCSFLTFWLYRPSTGQFIQGRKGGSCCPDDPKEFHRYTFGNPGDRGIAHNVRWSPDSPQFGGSGIFRPSTATWYLSGYAGEEAGQYSKQVRFGNATDQMLISAVRSCVKNNSCQG